MSTEHWEASQNLINAAMSAEKQSTAYLLIDAAKRIDSAIPAEQIKSQWLEQWLEANKNRLTK